LANCTRECFTCVRCEL